MTHRGDRTLAAAGLARVEGEGAMYVRVGDGRVEEVRLEIYEPPRFFEAFLVGRSYTEPPDITARICGICPVAYQTSACQAIEAACGISLPGPLADLRRLLYCGEWISSHALHIYMLHAPDFLGYPGAVELAREHREIVERGLSLRRVANAVMETIGGRSVHPVNVRVGGFYRAPSARDLAPLAGQLRRALDLAVDTVRWVAGFDFPDFTCDHELLALRQPDTYPIERGTLVSSGGLVFTAAEFERHVIEEQVPHSTALHARLAGRDRSYLTGPLARYTLNSEWLPACRGRGRPGGRARARLPQPVPEHRRPGGRDRLRGRGGASADRWLPGTGHPVRGGGAAVRDRSWRVRGAPRRAVPPVRAGRGRDRAQRAHRAPDVTEPGRNTGGPARLRAGPA